MVRLKKLPIITALTTLLAACTAGNEFEPQYNKPEGTYIYGPATQFSLQTAYGELKAMDDPRLSCITTWLEADKDIMFSKVADGHQAYVFGGEELDCTSQVRSFTLVKNGKPMQVGRSGLYRIIYSSSVGALTYIPVSISLIAKDVITEKGDTQLQFTDPVYDKVRHIVSWYSAPDSMIMLSGEYKFCWFADGKCNIPITPYGSYTVRTTLTGPEASTKTNVLSGQDMALVSDSEVNLKLKHKGDYRITVSYNVKQATFFACINGEEIIIPEPTGQPEKLWMDLNGRQVGMTPCGASGNGVFWTMTYIPSGNGVTFSTDESMSSRFSSLDNNDGCSEMGGKAVPHDAGATLIYVDLYNSIIYMGKPEIYAMGDCFNGADVLLEGENDIYSATTIADGDLRMYAVCPHNDRDWDSMEFIARGGEIIYRGTADELAHTPVAAAVPVVLDFPQAKADLKVTLSEDVPFSAKVYMINNQYGILNWGEPGNVTRLNKVWNDDSRWMYVRYFKAGCKLRFTTESDPMFGRGEFVDLDSHSGYDIEDGYAVIKNDGIYGILVNLGTRKLSIEPLTMHTYGTASNDQYGTKLSDPFTSTEDPRIQEYSVPKQGRLRFNPLADSFDFASWQREYYVDLETMEVKQRLSGEPEPNSDYVWTPGTKIMINYESMKASIE